MLQRIPNAPSDWMHKLPTMAKRLEDTLYQTAPMLANYCDDSTLKQRLQEVGMQMIQHQQQRAQQIQSQQEAALHHQQKQAVQGQQPQRMVNMSRINPIMSTFPQQGTIMNGGHRLNASYHVAPATASKASVHVLRSSNAHSLRSESRGRARIAQIQRLLLLRHAAQCSHEDGKCPVTPHCAHMKRMWKHMGECKNKKCQVPYCIGSKFVLRKYHRCKQQHNMMLLHAAKCSGCPVCAPVRKAIHRSTRSRIAPGKCSPCNNPVHNPVA